MFDPRDHRNSGVRTSGGKSGRSPLVCSGPAQKAGQYWSGSKPPGQREGGQRASDEHPALARNSTRAPAMSKTTPPSVAPRVMASRTIATIKPPPASASSGTVRASQVHHATVAAVLAKPEVTRRIAERQEQHLRLSLLLHSPENTADDDRAHKPRCSDDQQH